MASTKPLAFKEVRATLKRIFESSVGSVNDFDHGVQVKEEPLYVTKTTDKQEIREVISMKNKKEDVMWTSYGTWRGNGRNWSRSFNPGLPNIGEDSPSALENITPSQTVANNLLALRKSREEFIKADANERIRGALSQNIRKILHKGYVNLTNTTLTPDQQDLLNMGLNCHYMTKPKPHRKRLEMEILLDDIHQLEKNGKITTSTALQPTLLAEAAKTRGVYHSKLLKTFEDLLHADGWEWGLDSWLWTGMPLEYFTRHKDPVVKEIYRHLQIIDPLKGLKKILGGGFSLMTVKSMVTIQGSSYFGDDHGNTPFYISKKNVPIVTFFGWGFR
ncbi:hypothetical protein Pcinc_008858 [Petrolisthes cinctipes]|uniref:Uncharacterized protein n=1 Tax=Petrolisthes cinctipes TaxID=88211 RepID=A0AAE1G7X3_PETCI|nr:hypothetical protein Pcinc_008858 [Petrolisthes cinctipes]